MKLLISAGVATSVALAGAAQAETINWSGVYAGVHLGGADVEFDVDARGAIGRCALDSASSGDVSAFGGTGCGFTVNPDSASVNAESRLRITIDDTVVAEAESRAAATSDGAVDPFEAETTGSLLADPDGVDAPSLSSDQDGDDLEAFSLIATGRGKTVGAEDDGAEAGARIVTTAIANDELVFAESVSMADYVETAGGEVVASGDFTTNSFSFVDHYTLADAIDAQSLTGGVFVGYLYQTEDNFVLGVEADVTFFANADGASSDSETIVGFEEALYAETSQRIDMDLNYIASLRARVGVAHGRFLPYATGGVALAGYDIDVNGAVVSDFLENTSSSASASETVFGGVVGGGVSIMITDDFALTGEGLYYFFDDETDIDDLLPGVQTDGTAGLDNVFEGRLKASFRF